MFKETLNTRQLEQIVEALGKIAPEKRHKNYQGPDTAAGITSFLLEDLFWGLYEGCTLGWDSISFNVVFNQGLRFIDCERKRINAANISAGEQMQFERSGRPVELVYVQLAEDDNVFSYFGLG